CSCHPGILLKGYGKDTGPRRGRFLPSEGSSHELSSHYPDDVPERQCTRRHRSIPEATNSPWAAQGGLGNRAVVSERSSTERKTRRGEVRRKPRSSRLERTEPRNTRKRKQRAGLLFRVFRCARVSLVGRAR